MFEPLKPDDAERRHVEGQKLAYDMFKHVTTLSAGSILVLAAFLEKLTPVPSAKWLMAVSLAGFILAILGSVFLMAMMCRHVMDRDIVDRESRFRATASLVLLGVAVSFMLAIIALAAFAFANLHPW